MLYVSRIEHGPRLSLSRAVNVMSAVYVEIRVPTCSAIHSGDECYSGVLVVAGGNVAMTSVNAAQPRLELADAVELIGMFGEGREVRRRGHDIREREGRYGDERWGAGYWLVVDREACCVTGRRRCDRWMVEVWSARPVNTPGGQLNFKHSKQLHWQRLSCLNMSALAEERSHSRRCLGIGIEISDLRSAWGRWAVWMCGIRYVILVEGAGAEGMAE